VKDSVSVMEIHLHTVLTVVMLFFFGLISPGPNFIVVVQRTLNFGRVAGLLTGIGAATGDAVYATLGLFGVTRLVAVGGRTMLAIELLGGLYLMWLGIRKLLPRMSQRSRPLRSRPQMCLQRGITGSVSRRISPTLSRTISPLISDQPWVKS
jgi:amino acid exporter